MSGFKITSLARLAQAGLIYIYFSKLIDTIYHGIFTPEAFAGIVVIFNILAGIVQLVFFIALYNYFNTKNEKKLHHAGIMAIIGSSVSLLPKFLAFAILFQHESLFFLIRNGNQIAAFGPWFSAFCMIAFCATILFDKKMRINPNLKKALTFGMLGWSIMFMAQTAVIINYMRNGQLVWLANLINSGLILFVIMSTATFICLFFFYQKFTKEDLY